MIPHIIIEVGLTAALSVGNSPYGKNEFQTPYLMVEKPIAEDFYIKSYNSSRTYMKRVNMANPYNALWQVEFGYKPIGTPLEGITIGIGHQSEHEVGAKDTLTESFDYANIKYRMEY